MRNKILCIFILLALLITLHTNCYAWWQGGWGSGDLKLEKNSIVFSELAAAPQNPGSNLIKMYAKDDGAGTTKVYTLDSAGTETNLLNSSTGAPIGATFITQTSNSSLTAEQALSSLNTGLMQVTTTTGVISSVTTSAGISGLLSDETGSGALVFGTAPTFATNITVGAAGSDGLITIYSEQGANDYTASINPNSTMTSNAAFYLPADEPAGTYLLNMTTGGVIGYDTNSYVTPTSTQTLNFGGATLEIPNSDDPDTTVTGQLSFDTDGWLRIYNGSAQVGIPTNYTIQFTIQDPENIETHAARSTQSASVWKNTTGMTFTITEIEAHSDTDDYTFLLFKSNTNTDHGTANDVQIDSVACSTDGTSDYYLTISAGFDNSTIEDGKHLIFEHSAGAAQTLKVIVKGYFGADVN